MGERGCGNQGLKKKEKCAVSLISTLLHVFFFFCACCMHLPINYVSNGEEMKHYFYGPDV